MSEIIKEIMEIATESSVIFKNSSDQITKKLAGMYLVERRIHKIQSAWLLVGLLNFSICLQMEDETYFFLTMDGNKVKLSSREKPNEEINPWAIKKENPYQ